MNARPGRPSKLDDDVKKRLIDAIMAGNSMEPACIYAGITFKTYRNWMIKGEKAKSGDYFQFFQDVTRARAEAEVRLVALINKAAVEDWRAAITLLERRHPDRWANTQRIDFVAKQRVNEALSFIIGNVSDSAKAEIAAALAFTEHSHAETDPEGQEGSDEDG